MKIFISWSGEISGKVARILRDWLPYVIPNIQPYVSVEDIHKGKRWSNEIATELDSAHFGVLCVTKDNISSPWLNFEAGALSKSVHSSISSNVCPLLFGLEPHEITGPLQQFQAVKYDKDDLERLIISINEAARQPVNPDRLKAIFNTWWPKLFEDLEKIYKLIKKKVIWAYETSLLDSEPEINRAGNEGFKSYKKWVVGEGVAPQSEDCDILIYVFGNSNESKQKLRKVMDFVLSAGKEIPLVVYTRYASGDSRLSDEEFKMTQEHSKSVIANMPETLLIRLKEVA